MITDTQAKLLEQIAADKHVFGPDQTADNEGALTEARRQFQPVAEELVELGREGYIDVSEPQRESRTGHRHIVRVFVKGLTAKGRRGIDEARQRRRLAVLKKIYDRFGDSITEGYDFDGFVSEMGLEWEEGHGVIEYLNSKGYLGDSSAIGLSHKGIVEAERIITDRQESINILGAWSREDEVTVRERENRRFRVLRRLYDMSGGDMNREVPYYELQEAEGLDDSQWWVTYDWLRLEGLLEDASSSQVRITGQGIDEIERSQKAPQSSTEHFSSIVIQNNYGTIGAIQSGVHNTATVSQQFTTNNELRVLVQQLQEAIEALPDSPERGEALEQFEMLKEEAQAEQPRPNRIRSYLKAVGLYAKDVSVDLASSAIMKMIGFP